MASQSLYRRYRPRRFGDIKGQEHVVRALRDAVAQGREGQAYLFSGPRGTGKTTSARILAKVLNCERPVDGEPCCECDSCVDVERGTSYDVHELDAASNNKVEDIERIISSVNLGSPGRHKVYILDEVHMLSPAASAKLLKTLEEPPSHVVFVLATTNPEKVIDTIRSRTQHIRFHLLSPDTLAEHVRWVASDAGLDIDDDAVAAAVSQGAGSARDTLSALELIANSGGQVGDLLSFDEFVEALIERDTGQALTAMAHLVNAGHDPRTVAEEMVKHLRNGFLALMAPDLVQLPADAVDALAAQAQRLGAPALVSAIEKLGQILVELRHAPDPRVLVEVVLVQLTRPSDAGSGAAGAGGADIAALAARVAKLEATQAAVPAARPAPVDPATGRATLGGRAKRAAATAASAEPAPAGAESEPAAEPTTHGVAAQDAGAPASAVPPTPAAATPDRVSPVAPVAAAAPSQPAAPPPTSAAAPAQVSLTDIRSEWDDRVRPALRGLAKPLFAAVEFVGHADGIVTFAAPNPTHQQKCAAEAAAVQKAWRETTGRDVTIAWGGHGADSPASSPARPAGRPSAAAPDDAPVPEPSPEPDFDAFDEIDESRPAITGNESAFDRIAEAFPGAQRIEPQGRE